MGPIAAMKSFFKFKAVQEAANKLMWNKTKFGWMTITGALIVGASGILQYMESSGMCTGCGKLGDAITELGIAVGIVGLRRALGNKLPAIVLAVLMAPSIAQAQNYSVWLGSSVDADAVPNPAGHVCGLIGPEDSSNFSITCLSARGSGDGQPLYDISQGFARLIHTQGRIAAYGLAQGGISTSDTATTGLFSGGFAVVYRITDKYQVVGAGQGAHSSSLQGWKPRVWIGFRFAP